MIIWRWLLMLVRWFNAKPLDDGSHLTPEGRRELDAVEHEGRMNGAQRPGFYP